MTGILRKAAKIVGSVAIALAIASSGHAQVRRSRPAVQRPLPPRMGINFAKFGKGLLTKIDLTPDQRAQIQEVAQPRLAALKQINSSNAPPAEKQARRKEVVRDLQQQIESILTPSQRQRLQQLMQENRQKNKLGGGDPNSSSPY